MKTVREWFETLPDSIKELAIENAMKHNVGHDSMTGTVFIDEIKQKTLEGAFTCSFILSATEQGRKYWLNIIHEHGGCSPK